MRRVKIALVSRYVFDNWCSLLIEYLLAKYILAKFGFNVKLKMVISGRAIEVSLEVFERLTGKSSPAMYSVGGMIIHVIVGLGVMLGLNIGITVSSMFLTTVTGMG
jgi:hypothetical protein